MYVIICFLLNAILYTYVIPNVLIAIIICNWNKMDKKNSFTVAGVPNCTRYSGNKCVGATKMWKLIQHMTQLYDSMTYAQRTGVLAP